MFVPNWIEVAEPGDMNCTTRKPLSKGKSATSLHPRLPYNPFARSTSETGMTTTSNFRSTFLTLAAPLTSLLRSTDLLTQPPRVVYQSEDASAFTAASHQAGTLVVPPCAPPYRSTARLDDRSETLAGVTDLVLLGSLSLAGGPSAINGGCR